LPNFHTLGSRRVGLALSGGGIRGIAHIGVLKALSEVGIRPSAVVGTSVGSIIGAGVAAGKSWQDLAELAHNVFWPSLLHGKTLEEFCCRCFPETFADLQLPFAAIATQLPSKKTVTLKTGRLAVAINASCAIRGVRRPVLLDGERLKDGGISRVLPSLTCRELGADFVIASDVWEFSALLRAVGVRHTHRYAHRAYPDHYMCAVGSSDVLIQPAVPLSSYLLVPNFIDRLIDSGETAARRVLRPLDHLNF
jgi:NTE family protein